MEQINSKDFYQSAMRYGTYLGIAWALMYIFLFNGITAPMLLLIGMGLFCSSPFIAGKFVIRHHKSTCNGPVSYMQIWIFLSCMYLCASLLSTATNYIYLYCIDEGNLFSQADLILSEIAKDPNINAAELEDLKASRLFLSQLTIQDFTWEILKNNILNCFILPPVIATFVKKKITR